MASREYAMKLAWKNTTCCQITNNEGALMKNSDDQMTVQRTQSNRLAKVDMHYSNDRESLKRKYFDKAQANQNSNDNENGEGELQDIELGELSLENFVQFLSTEDALSYMSAQQNIDNQQTGEETQINSQTQVKTKELEKDQTRIETSLEYLRSVLETVTEALRAIDCKYFE